MEGKRNRYYEQTFVKAVIPIALRRSCQSDQIMARNPQ